MKILVTGFEPFGGEKINPAFEVIKGLQNHIAGLEVIKLEVPTAFYASVEKTVARIEALQPDFVLCIGQAGGRFDISIERIGINLDDARIPDNLNQQPIDTAIETTGKNAYFSTIPIKAITQGIRQKKIPASVSDSAGTYVCNHLLYGVLHHIETKGLPIKAGFIHIPFLFEQVVDKPNTPAMDLSTMITAIETAIEIIAMQKEDIQKPQGNIC